MSTHSKLSPSARVRWGKCPASVRESAKYPPSASGPAAIDGTHTHTLLEVCLKENVSKAQTLMGRNLKDHDGEFVVDTERASRVQLALDYIDAGIDGFCVVKSEQRVDPSHLLGRNDLSGTVDVQIHRPGMVEIIDYKDGIQPVAADGNPQLELYALGVLAEYKLPVNVKYPIDTVRMTIIQPKLALKGMPIITSWDQSVEELLARIPAIVAEAAATDRPDAPFVPGDEQCKYCPAKGGCSALVNKTMESAGITFQNLDVAKEAANKEPTEMTDKQVREIVESAPLLRGMLEAVEAEALRRLEAGRVIDGLKVVKGRGSRSWALDDEQVAEKLKKMGLPKDVIWTTKVISPAQIEKATWEKTSGGEKVVKKLSDRQLKVITDEYIKKSEGKLTVASASDPRPAVTMNVAPMFTPVDALPSWMV